MNFRRRQLGILGVAGLMWAMAGTAKAQPTYIVGATPTGVPFTFLDTKSNSTQGVMVDLIHEIASEAGFDARIETMQWTALIPSLNQKKIDIIIGAMYITEKRKEVIDFSDPVYTYGEGVIVAKNDPGTYKSFSDLKGEAVGAQVGTAYVEPLRATGLFSEVKVYESIADIMQDVNAGRLKAGFADSPIAGYYIKQGMFPNVRLAREFVPTMGGSLGIGIRKDDGELKLKINSALKELKDNGRLKEILDKWGLVE